jgi:hypothetical protein
VTAVLVGGPLDGIRLEVEDGAETVRQYALVPNPDEASILKMVGRWFVYRRVLFSSADAGVSPDPGATFLWSSGGIG